MLDNAGNIRNRAWEATWQGRYDDAHHIYNVELAEELSHSEDTWRRADPGNHVILSLLVGDLDLALGMAQRIRSLQHVTAHPVPLIGAILWLQGKETEACDDWAYEISRRDSGIITHCDGAGGVDVPALLWWATAHPGLEGYRKVAERQLKKRWCTKHCRNSRWPGPLVPYLLGQGAKTSPSDEVLLHKASTYSDRYPEINFRNVCQAHFYVGASCLALNDTANYHRHMEQVTAAKSPPAATGEPPMLNGVDALRLCDPTYHLARAILEKAKDNS